MFTAQAGTSWKHRTREKWLQLGFTALPLRWRDLHTHYRGEVEMILVTDTARRRTRRYQLLLV